MLLLYYYAILSKNTLLAQIFSLFIMYKSIDRKEFNDYITMDHINMSVSMSKSISFALHDMRTSTNQM